MRSIDLSTEVLWCWDVVSGDGCRVRHMSDGDESYRVVENSYISRYS